MSTSDVTPSGVRVESGSPRASAQTRGPAPTHKTTTSPTHPTSTEDGVGGGNLIEALRARGVIAANAQTLVADYPAPRVEQAITYFDALSDVGPGVLVTAIREGRSPAPVRPLSTIDQQQAYADQIVGWLNENFPNLRQPSGLPHPAAVAAVIRLHYKHGKNSLTKREHGGEIREAVEAWKRKWEGPEEDSK